MKKCYLFIALLLVSVPVWAQHTAKEYARKPVWVDMMDDTTANFFEVEKAYDTYWAHHEKPEGEHDIIGEHEEREKIPSRRKQRKLQAENELRMAIKRYERWHEDMLPWVQADGRILTPSERLAIWKAQQNNGK